MKPADGQVMTLTRDNRDFMLELGRQHGVSRLLDVRSMEPLVTQFRPPTEGLTLPWEQARKSVRFRPGKVSIWSGPTFAGKTALLRQLMLHGMKHANNRVLFISLEEDPEEVWREFTCMAAHTRDPSPEQVRAAMELFKSRLWVFDSAEPIDPTVLFGIIRYGVQQFGFAQVVIDSLMRLDIRKDDFDGQRELGNNLGRLAKLTKAHIHLVAHPRKTQNSRDAMDLYDIQGAQDIVAQADLVLTLERKFKTADDHSNLLTVWKQRGDVNWIGKIPLHYCGRSRQLRFSPAEEPHRYIADTSNVTPLNFEPRSVDEFEFPFPADKAG